GKVYLRILSNLPDRCLARARCVIPPDKLAGDGFSGEDVRDGIIHAFEFADSDPYRAVTHNKGIMDGIAPLVIATGHHWTAVGARLTNARVTVLPARMCGTELFTPLNLPTPIHTVPSRIIKGS